jgi:hypothetical protein
LDSWWKIWRGVSVLKGATPPFIPPIPVAVRSLGQSQLSSLFWQKREKPAFCTELGDNMASNHVVFLTYGRIVA